MKTLIILTLVLVGCSPEPEVKPEPFVFVVNGERVSCDYFGKVNCGITLKECSNGKKYYCVTNLIEEK